MPAEISERSGRLEAFTALTPAWWDGKREYLSDHYLTSDEVWGERGVLNFGYEMRPIFDESGRTVDGFYRSVRTDTGRTVGCGMTSRYKLVQPREAFDWLDSLMNDGVMKYASAGVLKDGREIWILGLIPDADEQPIEGERHDKYILWTDRFDGSGSLNWFPCATRVECANTLAIAMTERGKTFHGIRHTGDVDAKIRNARRAILEAKSAFSRYNADSRRLIESSYTPSEAREFVERLFPTPADDAPQRTKSIRSRKVQAVRDALRHPTNNVGDMRQTFWGLFNAVTFAVDHSSVFAFRGAGDRRQENRFRSLMLGDGADMKRKAFDLALSMAG